MNGWDLFTWISAVALGIGVALIFAGFLRDVRQVLNRVGGKEE